MPTTGSELQLTKAPPSRLRAKLESAVKTLQRAGVDNPRLDAELMLAAAVGTTREGLMAGVVELTVDAVSRYAGMVARRASREPLAYILGRKEFYLLDFEVGPSVLVPRPETETLVAAALEIIGRKPSCTVLDIGTGSGAIAIAIASNSDSARRVVATDTSSAALDFARRNAMCLGVADRIQFRAGDCWDALVSGEQFDIVVSNPPYVEDTEIDKLAPEIARFEPRIALDGGKDGLDFYRRIASGIRHHLKRDGDLLVEVGAGQAERVAALFRQAGAPETMAINDLAGVARVVRAQLV